MKNLLFGMAAFFMLSMNLQAQDYSKPTRIFKKGQTDIQFGYGLLTTAKILDGATTKLPAFTVRGDRFMSDNFSLGVSYAVSSHQSKPYIIPDGFEQRVTNTTHQLAIRPTFHMTNLKNADLYGGFQIGLNFETFKVDQGTFDHLSEHQNLSPQQTKGIYAAFIGGRYVISKKWTAFGELGFTSSIMTVGVGYRL